MASDNSRIAKNSLMLYIRMLVTTFIGLWTSRVVLDSLGITDYGIYNVIGGVVALFGFVQHSMVNATSRYITYALGQGDSKELNKVFSMSLILHAGLCVLIVVVVEIVGLWFLYHHMTIPDGRMNDAFWVFQLSVATIVLTVMSFPYNSLIIAHERMGAFAWISMAESIAKLLIAFILYAVDGSRLVLYAFLLFFIQLLIRIAYSWYCSRHFEESHFCWSSDRTLMRKMLSFAGFSLLPGLGFACCGQGLNVLLNMFFGPVANAARGISVQVQGLLTKFTQSFQQAAAPQITKLYAQNEKNSMHALMTATAKLSFFIMLIPTIPLMLSMDSVLGLWLKEVPDNTADFCRMTLVINLLEAIAYPFLVGASANEKIGRYFTITSIIMICTVPIAYVALKMGYPPISVYVVHLALWIILLVVRVCMGARLVDYNLSDFVSGCLFPFGRVFVAIIALCWMFLWLFPQSNALLVIMVSSMITLCSIVLFGLTAKERQQTKSMINTMKAKLLR